MTPEEITAQVLAVVGPLIVTAIGTLGTWLIWTLKNFVDAKVHDARFHCATEKIAVLTSNAMAEAEQTVISKIRGTNKWNDDAKKAVKDSVVGVVKRHLGSRGLKELKGCLGHNEAGVEALIRTQIESGLAKLNTIGKPRFDLKW